MVKQNTNSTQISLAEKNAAELSNVGQDLKNSILVVSVVLNVIIFTFWLTLQVTTQYNDQLSKLLFG